MRLTPFGRSTAFKALAVLSLVFILVAWFVPVPAVLWLAALIWLAGGALVLNFFRDPERSIPQGDGLVVAPADGRIVVIKELEEREYLKCSAVQISIFMSPLNVHVNRFPVSGMIGFFRHIQGEYLVAFHEKSSELNERTLIGIEDRGYKVLMKQIAGAVARRIVAPIAVGERAVRGSRFGMIKFGSRVDLILPKPAEVRVSVNQAVVAGETIIASYTLP